MADRSKIEWTDASVIACITKTRRGNPGMIRRQIVQALCTVLEAEPKWLADRARLIFAMQTFDFAAQFTAASAKAIEGSETVSGLLVEAIAAHLDDKVDATPAATEVTTSRHDVKAPAKTSKAPAAAPKEAAPKPMPARSAADRVTTIGNDHIARNGKRLRIAPRAAMLLGLLDKAKPNCVGDEWLIGKLWTARPSNATDLIDQIIRGLGDGLKDLGLEIRTHRGVGRRLVEVDAV